MKFIRETIRVTEARRRIAEYVREGEMEHVPLIDALGRRLGADVAADHPVPHFRRAGMDGFAVRAVDVAEARPDRPAALRVIATLPSGVMPACEVGPGEAVRIMTGAVVPEGADAVVMFEATDAVDAGSGAQPAASSASSAVDTARGDAPDAARAAVREAVDARLGAAAVDAPSAARMPASGVAVHRPIVCVKQPIQPGGNVTPIGAEIAAGSRILDRGRVIGAGEAGLLAAFGYASVPVFRRPVAALLATGSELLDVTEPIRPGMIRNSNTYMTAAQIRSSGGTPLMLPKLPDDVGRAMAAIDEAFSQADVVVTTGGVSVGDFDVMTELFAVWGGQTLFDKVAIRPGSPTTVGFRDGKLLFALSGNPSACFVGFELFVRPALAAMQGLPMLPDLPTRTAWLGVDFPKPSPYPRFVRGRSRCEDGRVIVSPTGADKSSLMISIVDADCLIVIPPGGRGMRAGDPVQVMPLPRTGE